VMVWAAFCMRSKTPICWISTKMDSRNYTDLLDCALIPFFDDETDEDDGIFSKIMLLSIIQGTPWHVLRKKIFRYWIGQHDLLI
jgi:hypothetical protein